MQRVDLNDFAGGLSEQFAADNFTGRQWAKLKGFVMDTDLTMRTQWGAQSIGGSTAITNGAKSVAGFTGSSNSYLVAIANDGYLWHAVAPVDTANFTVANAVTWTRLSAIAVNTDYRFITEVLLPIAGLGEVNALLVHSVSGTTPAVAIYENDLTSSIDTKTWARYQPVDQPNLIDANKKTFAATSTFQAITTFVDETGPFTVANDGPDTVEIKINSGGAIIATIEPFDSFTHSVGITAGQQVFVRTLTSTSTVHIGVLLGSFQLPMRNVIPRANVGCMWRNRLILGDIQQRRDTSLAWTATNNIQRAPYAFFYSEDAPDAYHEQSILFAGSGESQILGLHVLDDYLISITSPATDTDGLRTFKGTLNYIDIQEGTVTININVLRGGIGPTRDLTTSGNRVASTIWSEAGVVVLLDGMGGVWYTDGIELDRLDHVGPINPDVTTAADEVAAIGRFLFMKRAGRYLILNMMGGTKGQDAVAAWTELVFPDYAVAPKSFHQVANSMYFVMDDRVYRFSVGRNSQSDTERLTFDNVALDATVATRTVADTNQHQKVNWFRYGMRTRGRANTAQVRTVQVKAGPALDTSTFGYSKTLNRVLVDRDEFVIPTGIGSAVEASGEVTFRGDLQLESATFWTSGGKFSRPVDGSDG